MYFEYMYLRCVFSFTPFLKGCSMNPYSFLLQESLGLVGSDDSGLGEGGGSTGEGAGSGTGGTTASDTGAATDPDTADTDKGGCGKGAWVLLLPLLGFAGVRSRRPRDR